MDNVQKYVKERHWSQPAGRIRAVTIGRSCGGQQIP